MRKEGKRRIKKESVVIEERKCGWGGEEEESKDKDKLNEGKRKEKWNEMRQRNSNVEEGATTDNKNKTNVVEEKEEEAN